MDATVISPLRLLLMRHAKSSWEDHRLNDHERPLNARGKRTAPAVARRLEAEGLRPELILVSSARRAQATAELLLNAWPPLAGCSITRPDLYCGGWTEMEAALRDESAGYTSILLLGHNPGWSDVATRLGQQPTPLKTGDVAVLEHPATGWPTALAAPQGWELKQVIKARECME